jgi:hypothetical protein
MRNRITLSADVNNNEHVRKSDHLEVGQSWSTVLISGKPCVTMSWRGRCIIHCISKPKSTFNVLHTMENKHSQSISNHRRSVKNCHLGEKKGLPIKGWLNKLRAPIRSVVYWNAAHCIPISERTDSILHDNWKKNDSGKIRGRKVEIDRIWTYSYDMCCPIFEHLQTLWDEKVLVRKAKKVKKVNLEYRYTSIQIPVVWIILSGLQK